MPINKDLKRRVRARMSETGERYTVALAGVDAPTSVDALLARGRAAGASDIHLDPTADGFVIRYRIAGSLRQVATLDRPAGELLLGDMRQRGTGGEVDPSGFAGFEDAGFCTFDTVIDGDTVTVRLSLLPTVDGDRAALRFKDAVYGIPGLTELGFEPRAMHRLATAVRTGYGIIAFEHEGDGVPPALIALVDHIADGTRSLIAIGTEPTVDGAGVTRVRTDSGLTRSDAMRRGLNSDPDGFVIDRLETNEEREVAAHLADTGHLVLVVTPPDEGALLGGHVVTPKDVLLPASAERPER